MNKMEHTGIERQTTEIKRFRSDHQTTTMTLVFIEKDSSLLGFANIVSQQGSFKLLIHAEIRTHDFRYFYTSVLKWKYSSEQF